MTELVYSATRVADAQALMTHQLLGKDVIDALIAADAQQSQDIEDAIAQLRVRLDIDEQTGAQLDAIGALVGQPRDGQQDATYRLWLKARILVNRSSGAPPEMYAIAYLLLGSSAGLFLRQIPVGHVLETDGYYTPAPVVIQRILQEASAVAVPFFYQYQVFDFGANVLTLGAGSTPAAADPEGFDNARLLDWIGPAYAKPDRSAFLKARIGRSLVAAWDARDLAADARIPGYGPTLTPFGSVAATSRPIDKEHIDPVLVTTAVSPETGSSAVLDVFAGGGPWTVAGCIDRPSLRGTLFCAYADVTDESLNMVTAYFTSAGFFLEVANGSTKNTYFAAGSPGSSAATPRCFVAAYDGAVSVDFWLDGTKFTDTGPTYFAPTFGADARFHLGPHPADIAVPGNYHYGACVLSYAVTDAVAALLTGHYLREMTDSGYY